MDIFRDLKAWHLAGAGLILLAGCRQEPPVEEISPDRDAGIVDPDPIDEPAGFGGEAELEQPSLDPPFGADSPETGSAQDPQSGIGVDDQGQAPQSQGGQPPAGAEAQGAAPDSGIDVEER